MLIYSPLQYQYLSQGFGENQACIDNKTGKITGKRGKFCPVGTRGFYTSMGMKGHNGLDLGSFYRQHVYFPVWAECDFIARHETDTSGGVGLDCFSKERVHFEHLPKQAGAQARKEWENNDNKVYIKFRFWHAQRNAVENGTEVKAGDLIQYADSTGASSGHHAHWGMKFVDEHGRTLDTDNGYYGAVDFTDWLKDTFILDWLGKEPLPIDANQQMDRAVFILRRFLKKNLVAHQLERVRDVLKSLGRL